MKAGLCCSQRSLQTCGLRRDSHRFSFAPPFLRSEASTPTFLRSEASTRAPSPSARRRGSSRARRQLTHDAYLEYTQAVLPAKASLAGTSKALAFGAKLKAKRAAAAKAAAEAAAGGAADVGGGSGGLAMLALAGKAGKAANASPAPAAPPAADVAIDVPPPPPADPDSDLRT